MQEGRERGARDYIAQKKTQQTQKKKEVINLFRYFLQNEENIREKVNARLQKKAPTCDGKI